MKILIFLVEYRNQDDIINLIAKNDNLNIHWVVACNYSKKPFLNQDNIEFIINKTNDGYINPFINYLKNNNKNFDYKILSNSDIIIDELFFKKLIDFNVENNIGLIAPNIRLINGANQNPNVLFRPSKFKMLILRTMYSNNFFHLILLFRKKIKDNIKTHFSKKYMYSAHGSFLIFTKNVNFRLWSNFNSFLQDEEYYIAEELILQNKKNFVQIRFKNHP